MNVNHTVSAFLGRHGLFTNGPDISSVIEGLLFDMQLGLDNDKGTSFLESSQEMIPTWTKPPKNAPKNERVIVIDAGGTNFRSCLVEFDSNGDSHISELEKCSMPGTKREFSKEEFFDTIASYLDHLKDKATKIGFCFSYAMSITPEADGKVIAFSKEIKAPEVVGCLVGESLKKALVKRGWKKPERVVLLNDTTAALLAGASLEKAGLKFSSYVGIILGTGMNTAYIESNPIKKIQSLSSTTPESQIVVCESGLYDKIAQSEFDRIVDKASNAPGTYVLEKMCSGAYLWQVASVAVKIACEDGLFSEKTKKSLLDLGSFSLFDIDRFLYTPYSTDTVLGKALHNAPENDYDILYALLDAFIDRCARLTTAIICAGVIKTGKGTQPSLPVSILCDGTTFYKTHNLRNRIVGYLNIELIEKRRIYFEALGTDNAITLGAAIAGLSS